MDAPAAAPDVTPSASGSSTVSNPGPNRGPLNNSGGKAGAAPLFFLRLLSIKWLIVVNAVKTLKKHLFIHFFLFFGLVGILTAGGTAAFYGLFNFLLDQEVIGAPVVDLLLNMVLLIFFTMLVFSNLIITLSTTYISKEVDHFISQPVSWRNLFLFKLVETSIYSSWAFIILSLPLFLGYGIAKELPLTFYLIVLVLLIPFLMIPSAIGAIVTMVLAASIPARRSRVFMVVVGVGAMGASIISARLLGFNKLIRSSNWDDFTQFLQILEAGNLQILPNTWLAEGTIAAASGNMGDVLYWFMVLLSTGLFLMQICMWLVGPLYYRGWTMARSASSSGIIRPERSFFRRLDYTYAWLGRQLKALIGKDLRTFWRDPAQWSQLVILFGLLYIYVANIRGAAREQNVNLFIINWQTALSFLNMGATCFIVSIITTRFVYPMLSLEGRQFWVIGLAPISRARLIWQKYVFCLLAILALTVPLMLFSNIMLKVPEIIFNRSLITLFFLSMGLTALAVGLGAMTPNFREDNPARIANGLGGTMNIVLSLIYIGAVIILVSVPTYIQLESTGYWLDMVNRWAPALLGAFIAINTLAIALPIALGIRAWQRLEF